MARIVDLALQASEVLRSYSDIHDQLLGVSLRRWVSAAVSRQPTDYPEFENRLMHLESRLEGIRTEIAGLSAHELTTRAKAVLPVELDSYARTLARAIGKLRVICQRLDQAEKSGASRDAYTTEQLNHDKVAYDHAVQEYKRHGLRLKHLLSTY